ncbi:MAG TPA: hypothetical protein VLB29_13450 [Nocardioidaceae bacterium]|nr:hypothetical protein [Nocardioidaceae bacterium]
MFAQESTRAALLSKAGPLALTTGILITAAQLVMWPFDTDDHVATSQSVVFQVAGAVYFIAFCLLLLTLVLAFAWQAPEAGKLGVAGVTVAAIGTMALGGDLWFESFAVPWIADEAPSAFNTDPTLVLALGAVASYLLFAIGWALFGLASLRAGVFPRSICLAIIVGGLLGYSALLAPFGVPLGLAIIWLGVWMIRTPFEVEATSSTGTQPHVPIP